MEQQVIDRGEALPASIVPKGIASSALTAGNRPRGIVPTDIEQVWRLAVIIAKSGMAPRDFSTQEKITVALMHGLEIGLPPMMALQRIAVINNRPAIWGDAVPALALATGQVEDWEERIDGEGDTMVATCRVKRKGVRTPAMRTFSVADAKQARLWGKAGPWQQYPKRMLAMRARVAFRDLFADALGGLYIAEEILDVDERPPVDITPAKSNGNGKALAQKITECNDVADIVANSQLKQDLERAPTEATTPLADALEPMLTITPLQPKQSKPLPPSISRKVAQSPAPATAPAADDGLEIPANLRRGPAAPDLIGETTRFKIWLNDTFASKKTVDEIHTIWNDIVLPRINDVDAELRDDLMAILEHHERRL